jgi:hypothetical protein
LDLEEVHQVCNAVYFSLLNNTITEFQTNINRKLDVEKYDTYIAMQPFIRAEQDRALLRQIWSNREQERQLMKDHEGWKVGTLYGEPLQKSRPKEAFPEYSFGELMIHRPYREMFEHCWPDAWI